MKHPDLQYLHRSSLSAALTGGAFLHQEFVIGSSVWRLSLLAFAFAGVAYAQSDHDTFVRSSARPRFQVVDRDTVKFGPQLIRLFGIDAPEKGQTCDDGHWQPGPLAKKALEDFWHNALPATTTFRP